MLQPKMKRPTVPMTGTILAALRADGVDDEPLEQLDDHLGDALARAGDQGRLSRDQAEEEDEEGGHDEDHDQVIGDGVERVGDLDAEEAEKGGDGRAEDAVEGVDDPEAVL